MGRTVRKSPGRPRGWATRRAGAGMDCADPRQAGTPARPPGPRGRGRRKRERPAFAGLPALGVKDSRGNYCFTASTWMMTLMSFEKPYWMP